MKQEYKHLGYYNDVDDIIDLFPNGPLKGDEASIVFSYMKDGYGNFYSTDDTGDILSADEFEEDFKNGYAAITGDYMYIVVFSPGDPNALKDGDDQHGYFIDLYKAVTKRKGRPSKLAELKDYLATLKQETARVEEKIRKLESLTKK